MIRPLSYFYPRSPCGERLHNRIALVPHQQISIHALLAESDPITCCPHMRHAVFLSTLSLRRATRSFCKPNPQRRYFYPRSPCGERHRKRCHCPQQRAFLSTLSLRRATRIPQDQLSDDGYFYPRSPCGERLAHFDDNVIAPNFYPRSPCGERRT